MRIKVGHSSFRDVDHNHLMGRIESCIEGWLNSGYKIVAIVESNYQTAFSSPERHGVVTEWQATVFYESEVK